MQKIYVRLIESKISKMSDFDGICRVLNANGIHNVQKIVYEAEDFTIAKILVDYADFGTANKLMIEHLQSINTKTPT